MQQKDNSLPVPNSQNPKLLPINSVQHTATESLGMRLNENRTDRIGMGMRLNGNRNDRIGMGMRLNGNRNDGIGMGMRLNENRNDGVGMRLRLVLYIQDKAPEW